jgi:hypothetical protein
MDNNKNINLASRILMIAFMALGLVFAVTVALKGGDKLEANSSALNPFFNLTYVLLGATVLFAILFPLITLASDFKKGIKIIISLVILLGLFGITYSLASDSIVGDVYEKLAITPQVSKLVGAGIMMTYVLAVLAVLAVVVTSISSIFKR